MKKSSYLPLAAAGLFFAPSLMLAQAPAGQPAKAVTPTATEEKKADTKDASATATADPSRVDDAAKLPKGVLEQFEKLDTNKDRLISILEFASYSEAEANPARDASSSTGVGKNGTGPGTAGSTTGSTGGITGKDNDAKPKESPNKEIRFKELDVNADASLSIEEFAAARPANIEATRDASSSTGVGKNGTGPGTAGSTTGSTNASTKNLNGKEEK